MGIDTTDLPEPGKAPFSLVGNSLQKLSETLEAAREETKGTLRPIYLTMQTSYSAIEKAFPEEKALQKPYYEQAMKAVLELLDLVKRYDAEPNNELLKRIRGIAGHFSDRVMQRALELGGKAQLDSYIRDTVEYHNRIQSLYQTVEESAKTLLEFVKKNTVSALWTDFQKEKRNARYKSWLWMVMCLVFTGLLLALVTYEYRTIEGSTISSTEVATVPYILAVLPKLLLKVLLGTFAFLSWRMFNNYKHIETAFLLKENAAKLIPLLVADINDPHTKSQIYTEFLNLILHGEPDGFIKFAAERSIVDIQNISK
tara:strand:+ start:67 stop:1005 length:939 start_codon:yes stop_codon:yes gene_type:complete